MKAGFLAISAVVLGLLIGSAQAAPHIAAAHPENVKVEFENAKVRVMRLTLAPHQKMDLHEVGDAVTIPLTDYTIVFKDSAGKTREIHRSAGKPEWVPAGERSSETGDQPAEAILIEIKTPAAKP